MFENSVVESRKKRASARRWSILPLSLTLHLLAIGGAIFGAVWDVDLPKAPPAQVSAFVLDASPPLPPPAPPIRRGNPEPAKQPATTQIPTEPVAPNATPDKLPLSDAPSGVGSPDGVVGGDPDGDPNGMDGGVVGGVTLDQKPPVDEPSGPLRIKGDVKPPVVTHRVDPQYPRGAIAMRVRGSVIVECIIGRDGAVHDARLVYSTHPILNDAVLTAVRQWRFRPGTLNGKAVDTIFQLTVRFDLR